MSSNKFAISALAGAFADEAQFPDPFRASDPRFTTTFTIRRAGSNALQKISVERAKKDKLRSILAQGFFSDNRSEVMQLALKAGYSAPEVIAAVGEFRVDDALARLVKWEDEPNGTAYDTNNAREFLTLDWPLTKEQVPADVWEMVETEKREEWADIQESLSEDDRKPFKLAKQLTAGDIYCTFIRWASKQTEAFRTEGLGEAAKN